ncbi:hypothetical protein SAMN04488007_3492 [Maribacter aquivivus]|uniref:Uncharacterized protein n=1 Tax=Maribacter aquivivus TaxID=228958 RepID=A0A1M6U5E6_9FLAO|nr:hypothetical protein [Maribacter aquivivus]SHK64396.1 hypothetical protein SAMN04488007_3492 [Maribacter aquivivus]
MELNFNNLEHIDYKEEFLIEYTSATPFLDIITSNIYIIYLVIKYGSIKNYVYKVYEDLKIETFKETENVIYKMNLEDYENYKLDFNIHKSLFKHYYLLSSSAKRTSFKEHENWILKVLLSDIKNANDDRMQYLFLSDLKKNTKKTLKYIHIIGSYEKGLTYSLDNIFIEKTKLIRLMELLKKHEIINNQNRIVLGKEYYAVLIFKLKSMGIINFPSRGIVHEIFEKQFGNFSYGTLCKVLKTLEEPESNKGDKLFSKLEQFYFLDELNKVN